MDGDIQAKLVYLLDSLKSLEPTQTVVTAGKEISLPEGTLLGHGIVAGTAVEEDNEIVTRYYASRTGYLVSVNSLTYVAPLHTRYVPETGDVVIGRVVEVAQGRWSVDINASHLGKLMLTSVSLPSGEQRRKTDAEVVDMRRFFAEDDIVFTEVQKVNGDQTCNLHSRNARYGKLFNGCMVAVPAPLVKRLAQHSCVLLGDVYVVLGNNGFVWIGTKPETTSTDTLNFVESKEIDIYLLHQMCAGKSHACATPSFYSQTSTYSSPQTASPPSSMQPTPSPFHLAKYCIKPTVSKYSNSVAKSAPINSPTENAPTNKLDDDDDTDKRKTDKRTQACLFHIIQPHVNPPYYFNLCRLNPLPS